jgi:long-chain acyl-CoA synthetase
VNGRPTDPSDLLLHDPLAAHVQVRPDGLATVCGADRSSWADLDRRVGRVAGALSRAGVGPGDRVVWLAQNCHRFLETLLACARLGAVFAPLNWRQSADELRATLDDTGPRVVLWQATEIGDRVADARRAAGVSAAWVEIDDDDNGYEAWSAADEPFPSAAVAGNDPALLLYTAAFDGTASGALLSHIGLLVQAWYGVHFGGATGDDVYLNAGPLFHVGTLKATLATYLAGGTNVFVPRVEPEQLCRVIETEHCTGAFLQGPTIEAILEINADGRFDLSSLRAKPGPPGWNAMVDTSSVRYRSGYGQTEVGGVVTFVDAERASVGAAGWPAPLVRMTALAPDDTELPVGHVGELAVRGPVVMTGYHDRPEQTAARRANGWHHTNDLGRIEVDGSVTFIGPKARLIKSAAENIYPAEVEACLRSHPAVADAAVLGVPDTTWGQAVTAVVVSRAAVTDDELITHCRERMASYKKPRTVVFAEELPRTNGAIDRDALDRAFGGGGYPGTGGAG